MAARRLVVALALTVLAVLRLADAGAPEGYLRDVTAGAFAAFYVPFLARFAPLMLRPDDGAERVVTFLVLVVVSDTGGYVAGVLFGKHPIAPADQPEEDLGGLRRVGVACAVGGALALPLLLDGRGLGRAC